MRFAGPAKSRGVHAAAAWFQSQCEIKRHTWGHVSTETVSAANSDSCSSRRETGWIQGTFPAPRQRRNHTRRWNYGHIEGHAPILMKAAPR